MENNLYDKSMEDIKNLIQKLKDLQKEAFDIKSKCLCCGLDNFTPSLQDIICELGDGYRLLESCIKHEKES